MVPPDALTNEKPTETVLTTRAAGPVSVQGGRFPRSRRLLSRPEFQVVFDSGRALRGPAFTLLVRARTPEDAPSPTLCPSRLGLVIAKKNIRRAVQRNRVKRVLREYFRLHPPRRPHDVVVLARRLADTASNRALRDELDRHWKSIT